MRRILLLLSCLGVVSFLIIASGLPSLTNVGVKFTSAASEAVISRAESGAVFADPLNSTWSQSQLQAQTNWSFGGHYDSHFLTYSDQNWQYSANGSSYDATVAFSETEAGLSITVHGDSNGSYSGFYAISPPSDAELFHARITSTYSSIPSGFVQVGLYVRAATGDTNYIACASVTSATGTSWEIIHGTGNSVEATNFDYFWIDNARIQPSSADCTIVTNGNNYLAVYLNGVLVYQNAALSLGIQKPVEAYLGVETSNPSQSFTGSWSNFYCTQTNSVEAINLPVGSTNMSIVNQNGTVMESAAVVNGTGLVNIAQYHFPVLAYIKAYGSSGNEIASTVSPVELMGGDIYSAKITVQQEVGSVVGIVSDTRFFYILIPVVLVVLAVSLVLSYSRNSHRKQNN